MDAELDHQHVQAAAERAGLLMGASQLHGLLIGHACGGGVLERDAIWSTLQLHHGDAALADVILALRAECLTHLEALDLGLTPLLPDDACPLQQRVDALVCWSRGFLGGFGLAGVRSDDLPPDAREALSDLAIIAQGDVDAEMDSRAMADDNETAYVALVEHARVVAMLLHATLTQPDFDEGTRH